MHEKTLSGQRVAIYARCSTANPNAAIDDQLRLAVEFVRTCGGYVSDERVLFDAASGCAAERAGLTKFLALVEAGAVDCVVCAELSRLSRDPTHASDIFKLLQKHGVRLLTIEDVFSGLCSSIH